MKVLFLINNGFGIGGTIRTTFNLAGGLARRGHDVEVLSMLRHRDGPQLPLDPAVRLTALVELRKTHPDHDAADPLRGRRPLVYPRDDARAKDHDLMVERRLARYLRHSDADVVIATRAGLIASITAFAPQRMLRIGQEHLTRSMYGRGMRADMAPYHRRLDAFVTVTERDAQAYRSALRLRDTRLVCVPNSVPAPRVPTSDGSYKIVVAAGRLVGWKRFDLAVKAFAKVVGEHPDWQLRVYGGGQRHAELRRLVAESGLHNDVLLMGGFSPLESEWAKGAMAVSASKKEPFGMTLVEAMRCGLPVVSTNAPHGPAEIIDDGVDGRLTPVNDADALADALLELIGDPPRRARMAAAALAASVRFDPDTVAARYEELFDQLTADRAVRSRVRRVRHGVAEALTPVAWFEHAVRFRRRGLRPHHWPRRWEVLRGRLADAAGQGLEPIRALGPSPHNTLPVADALVRPDGSVRLALPAEALPAGATLAWRRSATDQAGQVLLGAPEIASGAAEATTTVDAGVQLAEGRWELFVGDAAGVWQPVVAGLRDTRALLDGVGCGPGGVLVRLPYRTGEGFLALRVWRRAAHAEAGAVHVDRDTVTVSGRLIGAPVDGPPFAVELRRAAGQLVVRATAQRVGPDGFTAQLPLGPLAAHRSAPQEQWDVFVSFAAGGPVRLSRILDDVLAKSIAYAFPSSVLAGSALGDSRVRPVYTAQNEFALVVTEPAPE